MVLLILQISQTFSVVVRKFGDTDKRKSVLETFNNVNLDPQRLHNMLIRVIGDRNLSIDVNGKQTENGDYRNNSKYIRVEVLEGYPITWDHLVIENTNPLNVTTPSELPNISIQNKFRFKHYLVN